jgi:hypothetical protein
MIQTARRTTAILSALIGLAACGYKSPAAPTSTSPAIVSLTGIVTALDGTGLSGATVRIDDGLNAGKFGTTNNDGEYRFDGLTAGNGNVTAVADGYDMVTSGTRIDGRAPLNFRLRTHEPWTQSGTGNAVFFMPLHVSRVRIVGVYTGVSSFFVVHVGRCAIVDDRLGTDALRTRSEGSYLVLPAGNSPPRTEADAKVEILDSPGVSWTVTEDRDGSGGTPCFLF